MDKTPARIAEEAAQYFARGVRGGTPAQRQEVEAWQQADPRHARAYEDTRQLWEQLGALGDDAELQALKARDLAALRRRDGWFRRMPMLAAAAVVVVMLSGGYLLHYYLQPSPPVTYATALGERHTETLQDGSRVVLNTSTELQVQFARNRREIDLQRGEAQFEVAHDAARPFVVRVGDGRVTALGTRFQVRRNESNVVVTLLEGSVEVALGQDHHRLQPNEQARLSVTDGIALQVVDPALAEGWLDGWLRFRDTPLSEVITEANRYSVRKLRLGDPKLADVELSGNFKSGDSASVATAAELILPVRAVEQGGEIVLLPK